RGHRQAGAGGDRAGRHLAGEPRPGRGAGHGPPLLPVGRAGGGGARPPVAAGPVARPSRPAVIRVRRHTPRHMAGRRPDPPQGDGGGAGAPAHVGGGDRPRRGGWVLPAVLAAVTIGAGAGAVALDADPVADATGVDRVVATPVLSARRAPEVVASPVADRRLAGELESWLEDSPEDSCLVVEAQGREVLAHNADLPLTGASTQKLLTATGLLLAHGPDATFTTEVVAEAPPAGGVVAGDLYVIGGGPADLGTPDWPEMAP